MKLNNKGKSVVFATLSVFLYSLPLIGLAIIKSDELFKSTETALSAFSIIILLFFFFFAKKVVKSVCKVLTPLGFGSLLMFFISLGLRSFLDDLFIISLASLIGSILAWTPFQISVIFGNNIEDGNGNPLPTITVKTAVGKFFGGSLVE